MRPARRMACTRNSKNPGSSVRRALIARLAAKYCFAPIRHCTRSKTCSGAAVGGRSRPRSSSTRPRLPAANHASLSSRVKSMRCGSAASNSSSTCAASAWRLSRRRSRASVSRRSLRSSARNSLITRWRKTVASSAFPRSMSVRTRRRLRSVRVGCAASRCDSHASSATGSCRRSCRANNSCSTRALPRSPVVAVVSVASASRRRSAASSSRARSSAAASSPTLASMRARAAAIIAARSFSPPASSSRRRVISARRQ